ncbi:propanediol utilization protein [Acidimangrovimonas sediminis]|uniref:propanediol utilization protein n=1 Tax=Acidimangrovimonas sediminis TaxID=2056283 RepID=UPI0018EACBFA|nr:propanediol utilization protein [Acidimangrovimonas sediminis]
MRPPPPATVAGHFGEFLQGRLGPQGPVALVTLPCPALRARASHRPGAFALHQPDARVMTRQAAARFLAGLGLPRRGRFVLKLDMPPGGGAGASTAARVALARAAAVQDPGAIARACLASEGALDPLMFDHPARRLWASRLGRMLAPLPPPPRFEVLGGFLGPMRRTDPRDMAFPDIADLAAAWPGACTDPAAAAALASASARRTLALRHPGGDPTEGLARRFGALGFAIGHTGAARALLFAPGTVPDAAPDALRAAGFRHVLRFRTGGS